MEVVIEEADESAYWLEISEETNLLISQYTTPLIKEANELISILGNSVKTLKQKHLKF